MSLYFCIKMYKLLIDSDALIKISKADLLEIVVKNFDVFITEEVYDETVKVGKKGFYLDADKIESFIQNGNIKILKGKRYRKKKKPKLDFGKGEISIYRAYDKNILIVSDDLSFTSYVKKENLKIISSAHLLFVLVEKVKLKKDKAYYYLEKLKPYIRKEVYELIKRDIKGE